MVIGTPPLKGGACDDRMHAVKEKALALLTSAMKKTLIVLLLATLTAILLTYTATKGFLTTTTTAI